MWRLVAAAISLGATARAAIAAIHEPARLLGHRTKPRFRVAAAPRNSDPEGSAILPAVLLRVQAAGDRGPNFVLSASLKPLIPCSKRHHDKVVSALAYRNDSGWRHSY